MIKYKFLRLIEFLAIILLLCCGGRPIPEPLKIWPPLGNIPEAVEYINNRTCNILTIENGEDVYIRVGWETRSCWLGGAATHGEYVSISVTPEECPMPDYLRTGLTIHEILHALGHWHHDEYSGEGPRSVMEPVLGNKGWEILDEDIQWLIDVYCDERD
jgi:hypothetical protein